MTNLVEAIKNASVPDRPIKLYAIETAVTDIHYDGGNEKLKKDYFAQLPQLLNSIDAQSMDEAPRPGDMRMIDAKDFDRTILRFFNMAGNNQFLDADKLNGSQSDNKKYMNSVIFGTPTMHAGGSLANTFDAMVHSTIDGQPIFDGVFQTAVGADKAGKTFVKSLKGHEAILTSDDHLTMTCHVVPIDGDRILITTPNGEGEWPREKQGSQYLVSPNMFDTEYEDNHINLDDILTANKIMIGGFINFTPNGFRIYDHLANMMSKSLNDPEFVLTAANQGVVEMRHVQQQIRKIQRAFNTTIHANTGEFRRLLGMDDHWRHQTEGRFDDLSGHALEDAKKADSRYQNDKSHANGNALRHAMGASSQLSHEYNATANYVATNGSRSTYQIGANYLAEVNTPKLDRSQIISTVGAGDNHMAGYQIGKALGLSNEQSLDLANKFAATVIKTLLARLDKNAEITIAGRKLCGPIAHALS